ncbi:MAG TPA: hypothetical protein H9881_14520 [Candidatus Stackebrandtia excrementipullorum]|nr:hypothetical protein [Candidatus Stackebrandtia excrementipullorum]
MSRETELLAGVRIATSSPDKSIRATYEFGKNIALSGDPEKIRNHSDTDFASEMSRALNGLLSGFRQARHMAVEKTYGKLPDKPQNASAAAVVADQEDLKRELSDIEVTGSSPDGLIYIGLRPAHGFDVRLEESATVRFGGKTLLESANAALRQTLLEYNRAVADVRKNRYQRLLAHRRTSHVR